MNTQFINSIKKRRSQYVLSKDVTLSRGDIEILIGEVMDNMPSAFNSQSGRILILFDQAHDTLWEITEKSLLDKQPQERWQATKDRISMFKKAFATILFFEEQETIQKLQEKYPANHENFAIWSQHASGMLQFAVWTVLAENNLGASLQHYNPLIDDAVKQQFSTPSTWKLMAQMPIGAVNTSALKKPTLKLADKLHIRHF